MNTYKFVQNNSGGYYVGPAEFVVRAESVDGAWAELKKQEWFTTDFCECCGERWYNPEVLEPINETSEKEAMIRELSTKIEYLTDQLNKARTVEEVLRSLLK